MDDLVERKETETEPAVRVSALELFLCFMKLGSTSLGGGAVGWIMREIVERRGWIEESRFMKMLTMAQIVPGANVVNISVYVGLHLGGVPGAIAAGFGIVSLPFVILLGLGMGYHLLADNPLAQNVLIGLACVGLASMMMTSTRVALQLRRHGPLIGISVAIFVMVGVLRWPMVWVALAMAPLSIVGAYWLRIGQNDE